MLSGGFAESSSGSSSYSQFPHHEATFVDDYDYAEDSDLEEDDDDTDSSSEASRENDGDSVTGAFSTSPTPKLREAERVLPDDTSSMHSFDSDEFAYDLSSNRPCRQIIIRDTAYDT